MRDLSIELPLDEALRIVAPAELGDVLRVLKEACIISKFEFIVRIKRNPAARIDLALIAEEMSKPLNDTPLRDAEKRSHKRGNA